MNIYYNKITPDDFIENMLKKVRKIHLNLPSGGILVFLTGREEVLDFCRQLHLNMRMIKRCKMPEEEDILKGELDIENLENLPDYSDQQDDSFITDEF